MCYVKPRPFHAIQPPPQLVATLASLYRFHKTDYIYPNDKINDCWEKVLLNQCMS